MPARPPMGRSCWVPSLPLLAVCPEGKLQANLRTALPVTLPATPLAAHCPPPAALPTTLPAALPTSLPAALPAAHCPPPAALPTTLPAALPAAHCPPPCPPARSHSLPGRS